MNQELPGLLELPSPFLRESGMLRLMESADSRQEELYERIVEGTYSKPYILEDGALRYLCFGIDNIQSAMRISEPYALDLAYTQAMMAFLLFNCQPRRIALIGLGGGSIAKYCYRYLPSARIVAVESDPDVIALRDQFLVPRDDFRFSVIQADGAAYLSALRRRVDALLVDAYDRDGIPPSLANPGFYENAWRCLSPTGMFVMNIAGDRSTRLSHLSWIRGVFGEAVIALLMEDSRNYVVFASKDRFFEPQWKWLVCHARRLEDLFGLEFSTYVKRLKQCCDFGIEDASREALEIFSDS